MRNAVPLLSLLETRVLGTLVEKQHTVPDTYPLSLNALVSGCNQKTSRSPVMEATQAEVQQALDSLKSANFVMETSGNRVTRYSHNLGRVLQVPSQSEALLTSLMLRGPQTAGELRISCERLHAFSDISAAEGFLNELAARPAGALVVLLPRQPGRAREPLGAPSQRRAGDRGVQRPAGRGVFVERQGRAARGGGRCPARPDQPPMTLEERARAAAELLERLAEDWSQLEQLPEEERRRLHLAVARMYQPDPVARRQTDEGGRAREARGGGYAQGGGGAAPDRHPRAAPQAGLHHAERVSARESYPKLRRRARRRRRGRHCYVCKQKYTAVHHFYDQLCPPCAELNFRKRTELADLRGRVALLTGGRVKIGYQAGLKLLRCGRAARSSPRAFRATRRSATPRSPTSREWRHRLEIFGLDLRHTPSVEAFCRHLLRDARAPGFHRQQRLPDGAPAAGVLRAHDGRARRRRCRRPRKASGRNGQVKSERAAELSQVRLLPEEFTDQKKLFPGRARSTRTCSRSTCAGATPGACCCTRSRRSSSSRCSWSTPSRRSCSTRASSR